jgi:hypothetical protein
MPGGFGVPGSAAAQHCERLPQPCVIHSRGWGRGDLGFHDESGRDVVFTEPVRSQRVEGDGTGIEFSGPADESAKERLVLVLEGGERVEQVDSLSVSAPNNVATATTHFSRV